MRERRIYQYRFDSASGQLRCLVSLVNKAAFYQVANRVNLTYAPPFRIKLTQ